MVNFTARQNIPIVLHLFYAGAIEHRFVKNKRCQVFKTIPFREDTFSVTFQLSQEKKCEKKKMPSLDKKSQLTKFGTIETGELRHS
jgi:hypothetical protein